MAQQSQRVIEGIKLDRPAANKPDNADGPKQVDDSGKAALLALLKVEAEARDAQSEAELAFLIANEMRKLTRARQTFVLRSKTIAKTRVLAVNSMDSVDRNSPLIRWIERMVRNLGKQDGLDGQRDFTLPAYCNKSDDETSSYPFREFVWLPFQLADGRVFAGVLLSRESHWRQGDLVIANRLAKTFAHSWAAITGKKKLRSKGRTRKLLAAAAIACSLFALAIPVPITALAPTEVVAANPFIVSAPIDGVVDRIDIEPNTEVSKGTVLLHFVDTRLRNNLQVAEREVLVAKAQLKKFSQSAFNDPEAKRELRTAMSNLRLKTAEADFARDLMSKTVLTAPVSGMAVFNDKKDWAGRPVAVGERIMQIADPAKIRFKIELPVDDAIVVDKNAEVRIYLDSDPLHPISARLERAAHEASVTANNVLAYELSAKLPKDMALPPRLGVRGTAQIYGSEAPLFFYLFRRPLSALRQHLGV